jgi:hypothetical protein
VIEDHQRDDETAQQVDHVEARDPRFHARDISGAYSERPLGFGAGLAVNV